MVAREIILLLVVNAVGSAKLWSTCSSQALTQTPVAQVNISVDVLSSGRGEVA